MKTDKYSDEPTADVDPLLHSAYLAARHNEIAWKKEADRLRAEIEEQIGEAHAGLVEGRKLYYHRYENRYRSAAMREAYPELTQHYVRTVEREEFDVESFALHHPEQAAPFQSRSFKSLGDL